MANLIYSGPSTSALILKETTFNTPVTPTLRIGGLIQSLNMDENANIIRSHAIGARATQALVDGMYDISGSIDYEYQAGRLIAFALGTSGSPSTNGTDYTHTIALAETLSSFTMKVSRDLATDYVQTYAGCMVDKLSISADLNSPLKVSADIKAASVINSPTTVTAPSFGTEVMQAPQYGTLSLYGATVAHVQSLDFTVNNNITYSHAIGSRIVQAAIAGPRHIDIKFTVNMDDAGTVSNFSNFFGDASDTYTMQQTVAGGNGTITFDNGTVLGSGDRQLLISLGAAGTKYDSFSVSTPVDGVVTIDISGMTTTFGATPVTCIDAENAAYI
jgi:hypothetical protein